MGRKREKLSDNTSLRKKKKEKQKTDMHRRPCISTVICMHYHPTKLKLS